MCPEKLIFLWNCLKKSKFFGNFPRKSKYFGKLPIKSKFFGNFTWKIENFCKITWKNQNFSEICPEKSIFCLWNCLKESKFFGNFPRKSNFLTRVHVHDPPDFKPDWRRWNKPCCLGLSATLSPLLLWPYGNRTWAYRGLSFGPIFVGSPAPSAPRCRQFVGAAAADFWWSGRRRRYFVGAPPIWFWVCIFFRWLKRSSEHFFRIERNFFWTPWK